MHIEVCQGTPGPKFAVRQYDVDMHCFGKKHRLTLKGSTIVSFLYHKIFQFQFL